MSIHLQSMAWKFSLANSAYKQKSNIKLVLIKLCDNASDEGYCWPSMGKIAKECDLSRRSVIGQIKKLKEMGLIEVKHRYNDKEQTSNGYQINISMLEGGELLAPPSESGSPDQCMTCTQNHNLTINETSGSDISKADDALYSLSETVTDGLYEFPLCRDAIYHLDWINESGRGKVYTGPLKWSEWEACEDAMRSVDCFDADYFTWWIKERGESFRKTPSLPNMLCDFEKTGTDFEQFYNSTFGQEWEGE